MGKNQSASNLTNIIKQDASGNITFVSGSTTLMSVSSSGAVTTTGGIVGSNNLATTGSNTFKGPQYISSSFAPTNFTDTGSLYTDGGLRVTKNAYLSSSLYIAGDLIIFGSQSVNYITSSQLNIADNIITVNTSTPAVRFGGIAVQDSGSLATGLTGSLLWDSQNNNWIYTNPSGSGNYDSAMVMMGPQNSGALGNEVGLTLNAIPKGAGGHHMTSSGIFESGSNVGIGTSNPAGKLDISGGQYNTGLIVRTSSDNGAGLNLKNTDPAGGHDWYIISTGGGNGGGAGNLGFYDGTSGNYMVYFKSNGNVGIGTTSPSQKLSIAYSDGGAQTTIYNTSTGHSVLANNTADKDLNYQVLGAGSHYFSTAGAERLNLRYDGLMIFTGTNSTTYKNAYFANNSTDFVISATEGAGTTKNFSIQCGGSSGAGRIFLNNLGFTKMSNDNTYYQGSSPAHELRSGTGGEWNTIMTSTAANPYGLLIGLTTGISNTGNEFISAYTSNFSVLKFKVASNGGIYNYQGNDSNLSDERIKHDIVPLDSYWDKFKAIEIVKFKYNDQSHDDYNIGVIAQQVESVAPEFINEDGFGETPEDGIPYKSVYTADLYHATIKVLQEAMIKIEEQQTQIESLKAEINALK